MKKQTYQIVMQYPNKHCKIIMSSKTLSPKHIANLEAKGTTKGCKILLRKHND